MNNILFSNKSMNSHYTASNSNSLLVTKLPTHLQLLMNRDNFSLNQKIFYKSIK